MKLKKRFLVFVILIFGAFFATWIIGKRTKNPLPDRVVADKILIEKRARRLTLFSKGTRIKSYKVCLGPNPEGRKTKEGDGRTPEGRYIIDRRKRNSSYHRALHISYPNAADVAQAKANGVSPGGDIMIHGLPNGMGFFESWYLEKDWTLGCVAVSNPEIEEIWRAVRDGTPVEIVQ